LAKSFVLCNMIEVEGDLVNCVYLVDGECRAQPFTKMHGSRGSTGFYKPTEEEQKNYCQAYTFNTCPRFKAYQDHLKFAGLQK
jgi:hypothetical protein